MHLYTKFGIPASNNIENAPDTIIWESKSEVMVTVTKKWYIMYVTLHNPKIPTQTNFGIPTSNNIEYAQKSQYGYWKLGQMSRSKWPKDGM